MNKNAHWPNHIEAQEEIDDLKGQYMGTINACKGTVSAGYEQVYMIELVDSLHT